MPYSMTRAEREQFLADLHVGVLSVAAEGRGPVSIPIWYIYQPGGELFFCSVKSARKVRLIETAGRFTVCAMIEKPPSKYVSVEGSLIVIEPCDFELHQRPIARRYLGLEAGDKYTEEIKSSEEMVTVRMQPERWSCADYSKNET